MRAIVVALALVAAGCAIPDRPGPSDNLPASGTLVYSNVGGDSHVRVVRVGDCYLTEVNGWQSREWLLYNPGWGGNPAVSCGPDAAPVMP